METAETAVEPEASTQALAAAHAALASGSPTAALARLAALPAAQRQELRARQLQALCHIKLAGRPCASQAWHKVRTGVCRRCLLLSRVQQRTGLQ